MRPYGAGGDTVEALLALDGHVGAVGSLELDIKGGCFQRLVFHLLYPGRLICRRMLTLGGVVEVLVDDLDRPNHQPQPFSNATHNQRCDPG